MTAIRILRFIFSIAILITLPTFLHAQDSTKLNLGKYMRAVYNIGFNGNVLVAKEGKIIFQDCYGYRNLDTKKPLNKKTVFTICSISKQFTAMAIMLLKEQHKLDLTDSLRLYFPELPYQNITIAEMLTHTSGLPDYFLFMGKYWDHHKIAHNADLIKLLAEKKPAVLSKPGTCYHYSNTAYVLLASIVEKVSGESFNDFINDHIFRPLHMNSSLVYTVVDDHKSVIKNYAYGYAWSDSLKRYVLANKIKAYDLVNYLAGVYGDGSVATNSIDLLKWDRALKNYTLLNKKDLDSMLAPHTLIDTTLNIYYGYGIAIGKSDLGNYISHEGIWPGYRAFLIRFIEPDLTIITFSNNESNTVGISMALSYIMSGRQIVLPYKHQEIILPSDQLEKYAGIYMTPSPVELVIHEGKLYRHRVGAPDVELKAESSTKFFYADSSDRQIEFIVNGNGTIIKVYLISNGIRSELIKK